MQLMPFTAKRFGVKKIFDPAQNIDGGTRYLKWLLKRFKGDIRLVTASYNAGENAVKKYGGVPPYKETRHYVKKVKKLMLRYEQSTVI
jgi:soluble lytic murein transglycosylase-like protein